MKKPEWKKIDFRAEIKEYVESLNPQEFRAFEKHYNNLITYGRSVKWLYFALIQLGTRNILTSGQLLYNNSFCKDVHELVKNYDYEFDNSARVAVKRDKIDYEYLNIICPGVRNTRIYTKEMATQFLKKYYEGEPVPEDVLSDCLKNLK